MCRDAFELLEAKRRKDELENNFYCTFGPRVSVFFYNLILFMKENEQNIENWQIKINNLFAAMEITRFGKLMYRRGDPVGNIEVILKNDKGSFKLSRNEIRFKKLFVYISGIFLKLFCNCHFQIPHWVFVSLQQLKCAYEKVI